MVEFENVSKVYADGTKAVNGLNLEIEKGEFVVLIGPSGCGKTTSLKMVNRLEDCSGGRILVGGQDITTLDPVKLRRGIGYVVQDIALMPHLSVAENIATVPRLLGWSRKRCRKRVDELLNMAGLDPATYRYRLPDQLSGGQKQRIGVLRALAADPDVILMDEPFGALDPLSRERLQAELIEMQNQMKKTIIFVTHDMDEALKLADKIVIMRRGKIEQMGTPGEIQGTPANDFVRNFLGEDRLSQIMPDSPVTSLIEEPYLEVLPKDKAADILEKMEDMNIESAQVINRDGIWQGMAFMKDVKRIARKKGLIREAVTKDRKLYVTEATMQDAAEMLSDEDIPVPVLDENGELMGIVTSAGIARLAIGRLQRKTKEEAEA